MGRWMNILMDAWMRGWLDVCVDGARIHVLLSLWRGLISRKPGFSVVLYRCYCFLLNWWELDMWKDDWVDGCMDA